MISKRHIGLLISLILVCDVAVIFGQLTRMAVLNVNQNLTYECMYQDQQSRIWIGTNQGLAYFDGKSMQFTSLPQSTPDEYITSIFSDQSNQLWIGGSEGGIYQLETNEIIPLENEEGHPTKKIVGFAETEDQLWIATYGEGVYYFDQDRMYHIGIEDGLSSLDVYAMIEGPDNRIWIATDSGINIISANKNEKSIDLLNTGTGLSDDIVTALHLIDSQVSIGFYEAFLNLGSHENGFTQIPIQTNASVEHISGIHPNSIWYSTSDGGLYQYESKLNLNTAVSIEDLRHPKIMDILVDHEGILWALDRREGLFRMNTRFSIFPLQGQNVQSIASHQNQLYIGTSRGAYTVSQSSSTLSKILDGNTASLLHDGEHLWIGTFGNGLSIFNGEKQINTLTREDGLSENDILDITQKDQSIFLSTLGGVTQINSIDRPNTIRSKNIKTFDQDDGLSTNYIYHGLVDKKNQIWFGTDGNGLARISNGVVTQYKDFGVERVKSIYCLAIDSQDRIWLSSDENKIFVRDQDQFHPCIAWNNKLNRDEVLGLVAPGNNHLFIIGQSALYIYKMDTKSLSQFSQYGQSKGIEPTLNAYHLDDHRRLWIGAEQNLIRVNTQLQPQNENVKMTLNEVSVMDQPISMDLENRFKSNENYITFDYSGLWYDQPHQVIYRFRMEGIEEEWNETRESSITYHHLPPGKYRFIAQASLDKSFAQSENNQIEYAFEILKPLWRKTWFIILAAIALASMLYMFLRYRERRLQLESQRKKELITAQFEMLKSQINPHFLFNSFNTLVSIIEDNPDDAVEYVGYLSDFYRNILQYREQDVIAFQEEIKLVENYMYLIQKRFGDSVKLSISYGGEPIMVAPLSLQLLIENAVKHNVISSRRPLSIEIFTVDNYIVIQNNLQPKSHSGYSTHYGLNSLKERYELLSQNEIQIVQSEESFIVRIPIIKMKEHADIDH